MAISEDRGGRCRASPRRRYRRDQPIEIKPRPSTYDIKQRIENALKRNAELEAPEIKVNVLDNGAIRLEGQPSASERSFQVAGSGVIFDAKNGYGLTNSHLLENADEITVTLLNHRSFSVKVIGMDQPTDVAVVQIRADRLTSLPLGDSSELRVGDYVAAVGNPMV